jgi:hypothetical protein
MEATVTFKNVGTVTPNSIASDDNSFSIFLVYPDNGYSILFPQIFVHKHKTTCRHSSTYKNPVNIFS